MSLRNNPVYSRWCAMKSRCSNPNNHFYKHYGGRGIKVCKRWINSFENFLEDMGFPPENYVLDRINNDGHYKPSNCRWVSYSESSKNRGPKKYRRWPDVEKLYKKLLLLKRTVSSKGRPLDWWEIASRLDIASRQLAHYHLWRLIRNNKCPRCPRCLQPLRKDR